MSPVSKLLYDNYKKLNLLKTGNFGFNIKERVVGWVDR